MNKIQTDARKKLILSLYEECQGNFSKIAKLTGVSRERVRQIYKDKDVTSTQAQKFTQAKLNLIIQLAPDHTMSEVIQLADCARRTLCRIKKEYNISFKPDTLRMKKYQDSLLIQTYLLCDKNYYKMDKHLNLSNGSCYRMMKNRKLNIDYPNHNFKE